MMDETNPGTIRQWLDEVAEKHFARGPFLGADFFAEVSPVIAKAATHLYMKNRIRRPEESAGQTKHLDAQRKIEKRTQTWMINNGWYIHPYLLPFLRQYDRLDQAESYAILGQMDRFFRCQVDDIEVELKDSYPNLLNMISEAFEAHRRGMFYCSINVLFNLSESICRDKLGLCVFMKSDREDILKRIDSLTRDCDRLFADPEVIRESQIWLSKGKRPEQFNGLNRHIVVHGERTDYNTERDSLQAISFVFFLHHVISEYEVRKSRSEEADTLSNTN